MSAAARRIAGLYAIADTGYLDPGRLLSAVRAAIAGGARAVQYRDKRHDAASRRQQAEALGRLCREAAVVFLVNDDVELAAVVGADGVHLGRDDARIPEVRARLGAEAIIGASCYNELARALAAEAAGADYVAFGSLFPSRTKPGAVRADIALLRRARAQLRGPIVAIGGITLDNGAALIAAGADALAVVEALFAAADIRTAAERFANLFPPGRGQS